MYVGNLLFSNLTPSSEYQICVKINHIQFPECFWFCDSFTCIALWILGDALRDMKRELTLIIVDPLGFKRRMLNSQYLIEDKLQNITYRRNIFLGA